METNYYAHKRIRNNRKIVSLLKRIIGKKKALPVNEFDEDRELIENIRKAKMDWINANQNFEYAGEQGIVDYYTYNIKACQVKYEYYIKLAKQRGLRLERIDETSSITK
ncbi:MAG: YaaL family protein [Bacteroidota bacterium]|nr:YaaL family protein [Bacteroidota bacterium]